MIILWLLFSALVVGSESIWIGVEYWTIVKYDGSLYGGRTFDDFIRFKGPDVDRFVAYWITHHVPSEALDTSLDNQFEAYGEAYLRGGRVCAKFVDKDDQATEICGGFRVLSRGSHDNANPFIWYPIRELSHHRAVEYLNHQIAQIWHDGRIHSIFGGAHIDRGLGYGVDINGSVLHVNRNVDAHFYDLNIEFLTVKEGYYPKEYIHTLPFSNRRHGHVYTPDDLNSLTYRRPSLPLDECHHSRHDKNGDGIVDNKEYQICRYGKYGCDIKIYDANQDGFLDPAELAECHRFLGINYPYGIVNPRPASSPIIKDECLNLRHDKNGDGIVDQDEHHACRYGLTGCNLQIYDSNKDGYLDAIEIEECQKYLRNDRRSVRTPVHHSYYPHEYSGCHHFRFDTNNDGIVNARELHACRYSRMGCDVEVYDSNKDGYLDDGEIQECRSHYKTDRFVRYCHDLYFDLNKDGIVDSFELDKCLNRHDPVRRRFIRRAHQELEEGKVAEEQEQQQIQNEEEEVQEAIEEKMEESQNQEHHQQGEAEEKNEAETDNVAGSTEDE